MESESESESEFIRQKRLLDYWRISIKNESILGVQIHGYDKNFVEIDMCADSKFSIQETKNLFKQHVKLIVKIPAKASNLENIDNKFILIYLHFFGYLLLLLLYLFLYNNLCSLS